jgi:hypothetical protein
MTTKRFDCAKYPDLAIASFELTVLTGADEAAAVGRAGESSTRLQEQLVADAITRVNDEAVTRPYVAWADWDQLTRAVVRGCYLNLHAPTKDEMDAFLATEQGGGFAATDRPGLRDDDLGLAFTTIKLGLRNGREENAALDALGEGLTNYQISEVLVGLSIVEVDGRPAEQPFDWSGWDLRSRAFVRAAHDRVAALPQGMLDDIIAGSADPLPAAGPTEPG